MALDRIPDVVRLPHEQVGFSDRDGPVGHGCSLYANGAQLSSKKTPLAYRLCTSSMRDGSASSD
jgi:hypothetical protein